ncbi:MAG: transposase [Paracoccaceae bacterium]|nr:transposase [Paracoccaceae bacterium]
MAGKKGQKKRVWSDEEKLSICTQARVPGVSVAQVARRYAMNTNLIHKWLRDPRFAFPCKRGEGTGAGYCS